MGGLDTPLGLRYLCLLMPIPKQRRLGRPPKRRKGPIGKQLIVRVVLLTPALDAWLKRRAAAEMRSVSSYTRWLFQREAAAKKEPESATA